MKTKFIFTIGGVLSGLGKGITTASIGLILKQKGFSVTSVKIDPYVSLDAGTMRPVEHGETFVTADGAEIDQDVGNYERFLGVNLTRENNITTGKVFQKVIENERSFKYNGRDAEMFPDVIDEIKAQIYKPAESFDFCLVEVGGTTGDLENMPFLHAAREIGREHPSIYMMVTYLPYLKNVGELKTKPTQHAVAALRSVGIFPDFIITRNEVPLDEASRETISRRCFVDISAIFDNPDTDLVYKIVQLFEKEKIADKILSKLKIKPRPTDLGHWNKLVKGLTKPKREVKIGFVGKYFSHGAGTHKDVYVSVNEALIHACGELSVRPIIVPIDSDVPVGMVEKQITESNVCGLVAPQGWGSRGTEGIIEGAKYARENKKPYLGLCFGMQLLCIEFARNVCGITDANSSEINPKTKNPVIHLMKDQEEYLKKKQYGGTIRLGEWPCEVKNGSLLWDLYHKYWSIGAENNVIMERHRHRYEFNNDYKDLLEQNGLIFSGMSPDGRLVEAVELPKKIHPFMLGTQYHPEYSSKVLTPHPLFMGFVSSCLRS
jgi:CTP synthase